MVELAHGVKVRKWHGVIAGWSESRPVETDMPIPPMEPSPDPRDTTRCGQPETD